MSDRASNSFLPNSQFARLGIVFAASIALLAAAYVFLLRQDYAVLFDDLRPEEAAAVVEVLEGDGIRFRLGRGGEQILVPTSERDRIRLSVAGSSIALAGLDGFELFDETDMGLTDFAQRIKYQRALQGELSRTIMMMDGIDEARVHIAMPQRTLFRGERDPASAAVTLVPRLGVVLTETRVLGIQRLVAAAVPDLVAAEVVVLDAGGEIISPAPIVAAVEPASSAPFPLPVEDVRRLENGPPDLTIADVERVRAAIESVLAGQGFTVAIESQPIPDAPSESGPTSMPSVSAEDEDSVPAPRDIGAVVIRTYGSLNPDARAEILSILQSGSALPDIRIGSVAFEIAPTNPSPASAAESSPASISEPATSSTPTGPTLEPSRPQPAGTWLDNFLVRTLLAIVFGAFAYWLWRRFLRPTLSSEEHQTLAGGLRTELAAMPGKVEP